MPEKCSLNLFVCLIYSLTYTKSVSIVPNKLLKKLCPHTLRGGKFVRGRVDWHVTNAHRYATHRHLRLRVPTII